MKALCARICAFLKASHLSRGVGAWSVVGLMLLVALMAGIWVERPPDAAALPAGSASPGSSVKAAEADHPIQSAKSREIAVRLKPGAVVPDLSSLGLIDGRPLGVGDIYVFDLVSSDMSEEDVLARVEGLPDVEWAEGEVLLRPCIIPDDPYFEPRTDSPKGQWGAHRVGLPKAWDVTTGSSAITVAIIDTGIDKDLPDFAGRIVHPCNVEESEPRTAWPHWQDLKGHGTGVAGVAVAQGNNAAGIAGAAWNVKIMPVKIGDDIFTDHALAEGIYWAVDHGADVINISFTGDRSRVEDEAIEYALERGVMVVAAGGNDPRQPVGFPARLPGVIGVSAIDDRDLLYSSSRGLGLDLAAPGAMIVTYGIRDGATVLRVTHGTSFAAPMVSGVIALMLSADPSMTSAQISAILASTAEDLGPPGWDESHGWGVLDAARAVTKAADPPNFFDVYPSSTPYEEQINALAERGVVKGVGGGLFGPNDDVFRQQFAKMIVLTMGYPVSVADESPFTDMKPSDSGELYPYHHVAVAWKEGITQGVTATQFYPYRTLSRAQMITMVTRAADLPEPPPGYEPPFGMFSKDHYPSARKAAYAGILDALEGMGKGYDFFAPATRGEVCALLYELLR